MMEGTLLLIYKMKFKDCQINKVYSHKNGELSVQFKMKREDYTPEDEEAIRNLWDTGDTFDAEFCVLGEDSVSMAGKYQLEEKTPKNEKLSVWEEIRIWVMRNEGEVAYNERKAGWLYDKRGVLERGEKIHLRDIFTEEEARRILEGLKSES